MPNGTRGTFLVARTVRGQKVFQRSAGAAKCDRFLAPPTGVPCRQLQLLHVANFRHRQINTFRSADILVNQIF
jgi:hypothetical protein